MIQPKIQEVYIPTEEYTLYTVKVDFGFDVIVDKKELITFTPEEFETFKREFGKELLKSVVKNVTTKCLNQDVTGSSCCSECEYHIVNKESITSVLDDYLKDNKI